MDIQSKVYKSQLRWFPPVLLCLLVTGFCIPATAFFIKGLAGVSTFNKDGTINGGMAAVAIVLLICNGYIIYSVRVRTLVVSMDENKRRIRFLYPLRLLSRDYAFNEVTGFQYDEIRSRAILYKVIKFKTSDGRLYSISDLETKNLREIEQPVIRFFPLSSGKDFLPVSDTEKTTMLKSNILFDSRQAKDYRLTAYIVIVVTILFLLINQYEPAPAPRPGLVYALINLVVIIISLFYISKANKTIHDTKKRLQEFERQNDNERV